MSKIMLKKARLFLFVFLFLFFASCAFHNVPISNTEIDTVTPISATTGMPTSTQVSLPPCEKMDLSPIKKAIKVIFTNGRLDTIQLEGILLGGNIAFSPDGSKMALSIYRHTNYVTGHAGVSRNGKTG
jgi:hypothetical protein